MKITEDVRKYAAEQNLTQEDAVNRGLQEKATEFVEKGGERSKLEAGGIEAIAMMREPAREYALTYHERLLIGREKGDI